MSSPGATALTPLPGEMVRTYPYESGAKYKLYVYIEVYHGSDYESDSFTSDPFP